MQYEISKKNSVKKALKLESQIKELKQFTIDIMRFVYGTMKSIDENSRQIMFRHFDQSHVNVLANHVPNLVKRLGKLKQKASNKKTCYKGFHSDDYKSDDSGNKSKDDDMN